MKLLLLSLVLSVVLSSCMTAPGNTDMETNASAAHADTGTPEDSDTQPEKAEVTEELRETGCANRLRILEFA